ncbi:tetratricopeptide repeat protein [Anaerolineae bacterium CFX7]|nr:tetratricopeptide repeat protein [Anaerolineae bacterium CFX7]
MDDLIAQIIGSYLAGLTDNVAERVGKTLADLWRKRDAPGVTLPDASPPYNEPPPLPLSETPLVGRETEFAETLERLRASRLVTLVGDGGVGKTALAQTIAWWMWETENVRRGRSLTPNEKRETRRGVVFIALDALAPDSALAEFVTPRLVNAYQFPATDDAALRREDAVRASASMLNQYARLVVLDNFESALEGKGAGEALAFVTQLLAATRMGGVRFLVTSRHALNLQNDVEEIYPVASLKQKDAIDLFYERAGEDFRAMPRSKTIADVAEICRMVDALPLAVELAARAVKQKHRPLSELRAGLRVTPLDIQAADNLGYPERQRGLAASFRYTYEHLSFIAQRLFCLLHIFRGSAARDALRDVDGTVVWETALSELVDWSLVRVETRAEPWRYALPALADAYSRFAFQTWYLLPPLDENVFRQRHAEHYAAVAARFDELPMERWRGIEETDWENIKQGADWAVKEIETQNGASVDELLARLDELPEDRTDAGLAGEYARQLTDFIFRRRTFEGRVWLSAGLIAFHRAGDKKNQALMCNELGLWYKVRGDLAAALAWYERSVALLEQVGDKAGLAATYNNIGLIHKARGDLAAALAWYERSVVLKEQVGDKAGLATTYNNIAGIHYARGDLDVALEWYERSVTLYEQVGDKAGLARTYNNIGLIHDARGDLAAALAWYERSVALREQVGDKAGLATTYNNIGLIHRARGDLAAALAWYERSVALYEQVGDKAGLATTYNNIGLIHKARGDLAAALEWYERSMALREQVGDKAGLAVTLHNMGYIALAQKDWARALDLFTRSRDLYAGIGLEKDVQEEEEMMREARRRME